VKEGQAVLGGCFKVKRFGYSKKHQSRVARALPQRDTSGAFRYSLRVLKIYSVCDAHYRYWVLAVNNGTQPSTPLYPGIYLPLSPTHESEVRSLIQARPQSTTIQSRSSRHATSFAAYGCVPRCLFLSFVCLCFFSLFLPYLYSTSSYHTMFSPSLFTPLFSSSSLVSFRSSYPSLRKIIRFSRKSDEISARFGGWGKVNLRIKIYLTYLHGEEAREKRKQQRGRKREREREREIIA